MYEQAHGATIGSGAIVLNDALCENLFAAYVCVLNGKFVKCFPLPINYYFLMFTLGIFLIIDGLAHLLIVSDVWRVSDE